MDNSKAARNLTETGGAKEVDWDIHKTVAMMPDSSDAAGADDATDFSWLQEQLSIVDGSTDTMIIAVVKKDQPNLA